ncbi:MAG: GMP reductase [Euryarchaeota archaeon]|jgi:GMP reductase|nr:GMP reductase [Euryarchaeota archaeon]
MRIEQDMKLDFKDVLFKPKRSVITSRKDVDLHRTFRFLHSGNTWTGVPIMSSNMDGVGTFEMAKALQEFKMITVLGKHYTVDDWKQAIGSGVKMEYLSICTGTGAIWDKDAKDYATMKAVLEMYPDIPFICVDVANGYPENYADFIARMRDEYPDKTIIAGNVITGEMTEALLLKGADIIKCGIGPGSVCTTRLMTGVGVPQLSGIIECADAANGIGGHIIGDGGCVYPGDVAKAFGAGAHFVMLGGMLAGHKEGGAYNEESGTVEFYGMSSNAAMARHGARKDGYRGAEGKVVSLPYKGEVKDTVIEILGGVGSAATYIGAQRIKDMPKCTTFVRCTQQVNTVYGNV